MKFPMKFEVEAYGESGMKGTWSASAPHLPVIECAIPKEFMGPGGGYSPEDLFGLAILNCVIALYKVYCEKSKISFSEIRGKASVTADKKASMPTFVMTHVEMGFKIMNPSDPEKAKALLETAIKDCPVSNSILSTKTHHIEIDS